METTTGAEFGLAEEKGVFSRPVPIGRSLSSLSTYWSSAWAASVERPSNDVLVAADGSLVVRGNEDRFRLDRSEAGDLIAGVADGAGGQGLYCGYWAGELLKRLPTEPIDSDKSLNQWLDGFWEEFEQAFKERARTDPFLYRKFVKEGSFSTLSAIWLSPSNGGARLNAILYGDSPLFLHRGADGGSSNLRLLHPEHVSGFLGDPHLLNWQSEAKSERVRVLTDVELSRGDTLFLASDGLGQYLMLRSLYGATDPDGSLVDCEPWCEIEDIRELGVDKLANLADAHRQAPHREFAEEFKMLRNGFSTGGDFMEFVAGRFKDGLLTNDDCTIVVVKIDSALNADKLNSG